MLTRREFLILSSAALGNALFGESKKPSSAQTLPEPGKRIYLPFVRNNYSEDYIKGLCYSPYQDGQDPSKGPYPSDDDIRNDIGILRLTGATHIRTYNSEGSSKNIPTLLIEKGSGIKVNAGCYIGQDTSVNKIQTANLIEMAKLPNVISVNVGNEALLFNTVTEQYLIDCIKRVRQNIPNSVSVTTGESWYQWLTRPDLVQATDYVFAHFYPYWEEPNPIPVENAVPFIKEKYNLLKQQYPGKRIVIGETGWASSGAAKGPAVPSLENQARFTNEFLEWARKEKVDFYFFETFDETWKTKYEGEIGRHWGLYYSNRTPKHPGLTLG